mgnify:FL=1
MMLIKAVQEQQKQIEEQRQQNQALKSIVCIGHPEADVCS